MLTLTLEYSIVRFELTGNFQITTKNYLLVFTHVAGILIRKQKKKRIMIENSHLDCKIIINFTSFFIKQYVRVAVFFFLRFLFGNVLVVETMPFAG